MSVLGIDPGLKGALSIVDNKMLSIYDIPVKIKPYGKGNMIDPQELSNIVLDIKSNYNIELVILESVSAMPGQGVSSSFSFGRSLGTIEGVISSYNYNITYITPQKWKKHFNLQGKIKDASRLLVIDMFESQSSLFKRKKDCDRADATLMAIYGKYMLTNT